MPVLLAALAALSGCTLIGAGVGAAQAGISNAGIPAGSDEPRDDVVKHGVVGAGIGLLIDAIVVYKIYREGGWDPQPRRRD